MKLDTFAKKTFESKKIQESWVVHQRAFGPILDVAFKDDYQARIHLCAALNFISRQKVKEGLNKLQSLQKHCDKDEDFAAWYFFMGLAFEVAGAKEQMIACYREAGKYHHQFYLPYLKVAKIAHQDGVFDIAKEYYLEALNCTNEPNILASIYTNLASALTMMHDYDKAEEMFEKSESLLVTQVGRNVGKAILYAARRDENKVKELLVNIKYESPNMYEQAKEETEKILTNKHPHFSEVEIDEEKISEFWTWFKNQSFTNPEQLITSLQTKLNEMFEFLHKEVELGYDQETNTIIFVDSYAVALRQYYQAMIEACDVDSYHFIIEH